MRRGRHSVHGIKPECRDLRLAYAIASDPPRRSTPTSLTPGQTAALLATLPITDTLTRTLATEAARLADAVRENLATPPGGPHERPWQRSGALQASIETQTDGLTAAVTSSDPAAAPQEFGTIGDLPRPFLAPAATALGETIANTIGRSLADLLRGALT